MYPIQLPIPASPSLLPPDPLLLQHVSHLEQLEEMASQVSMSRPFGGLKSGCVFTCNGKEVSIEN